MISYIPVAKIAPKYPYDKQELKTVNSFLGIKTAWSQFAIWKSNGYEILEARIDVFDGENKINTYRIDVTKI